MNRVLVRAQDQRPGFIKIQDQRPGFVASNRYPMTYKYSPVNGVVVQFSPQNMEVGVPYYYALPCDPDDQTMFAAIKRPNGVVDFYAVED